MRIPLVFNLRSDPFERADESGMPFETSNQLYFIIPGQVVVSKWLESFKEFPPRQRPASYNIDDILRKLTSQLDEREVVGGEFVVARCHKPTLLDLVEEPLD